MTDKPKLVAAICPRCGGDASDNWFDREVCAPPCDSMHTRCRKCGASLDPCPLEGTWIEPDGSAKPVAAKRRRFIKRVDSRYCLPADIEVIRVLASYLVANEDGGTGSHYEYDVLYEEVDPE